MSKLWVFQATAMASGGCTFPKGEKHALLVFAAAPDREAAFDQMHRGAMANGWCDVDVSRSGEVPYDTSTIQDPILRNSAEHAAEHGCGIVAYSEPLKK